jgi:thiol-disulfide isomerase/thioredoxin
MKKSFFILFCTTFLSIILTAQNRKTDFYEFKGSVSGIKDTTCMLAYYFGDKQFAKDTAQIDSNGNFIFKGNDSLLHGMYMIVFPNNSYMELVVTENQFSFTTNIDDLIGSARFKNSKENELFYGYMQYLGSQQKRLKSLQSKLETSNSEDKKDIQKELDAITKIMSGYQDKFTSENPNIFFSSVLNSSKEVVIPDAPILANGKPDSTFQYRYYKTHYFDNFDFSDERLLRSPIFHSKINNYIEKLTPKHADSIIVSCDYLIEKSRANKEVFKYMVSYLTSTYERSKIMGLEKVFVHLVKKHFTTDEVDWLDETQIFNIVDRAQTIEPLMLGQVAPNLSLRDTAENVRVLHQIETDFTVLIFYDPDCGHCKKELPVIKQKHDQWLKDGISVEVYCVSVELDKEKWLEFIRTYDTEDWINVAEFRTYVDGEYNRDNDLYVTPFPYIKQLYDINGTPKVYLLDKEKRILVNAIKGNIGVDQLSELLYLQTKN